MQITIELEPETAAAARAQAERQGVRLQEYISSAVRRLTTEVREPQTASDRASVEEFVRDLDRFSEGTETLQPLSEEMFTRAAIYDDHD